MKAHYLRFLLWWSQPATLTLTDLSICSGLCLAHDAVCVIYQGLEIVYVVSKAGALVVLDRGLK